jgi:ADP-heptose:LPS heptosyltransferase
MDCFEQEPRRSVAGSAPIKTIGFLPGTRSDAKLNLDDFEKVAEELINLKDPDTEFGFLVATALPNVPEFMKRKSFSEVLAEADLIVGLSGTGNEQAAGSGIPIVSFYGRGSQYNKKFALAQKQLLGESLGLVKKNDPRTVAAAVWQLLKNPDKMKEMGKAGKERMGQPGAADKIAGFILSLRQSQ